MRRPSAAAWPSTRNSGAGEELANIRSAARQLAEIVRAGHRVALVHGNGPQVGAELVRQERAAGEVPPMPMDICGAHTQGEIGCLLQQVLGNELRRLEVATPVVAVVTQVRMFHKAAGNPSSLTLISAACPKESTPAVTTRIPSPARFAQACRRGRPARHRY